MDIKEINRILASIPKPSKNLATSSSPSAPKVEVEQQEPVQTVEDRRAKYPELFEVHDKAQARLDELNQTYLPLRKAYEDLRDEMAPMEDKLREISIAIKQLSPEVGKCQNIIASIHRATGGRGIKVESGGVITK
jgi:chromosome segregation ATPase